MKVFDVLEPLLAERNTECQAFTNAMQLRPTLTVVSIFRTVQEIWQVSVPWPGQCGQNNTTAHAQRRQTGTACADLTSK